MSMSESTVSPARPAGADLMVCDVPDAAVASKVPLGARLKSLFARSAGGAAGAVVAMAVPHIGCVAALLPAFVGAGASAGVAVGATYATAATLVVGGGIAAYYGLRPSREACCIQWGETPRIRAKKALAVAAFSFVAMAGINSLSDNGLPMEARAQYLQEERELGGSLWQAQDRLNTICSTPNRSGWFFGL